jgi:hypothetical protein
MKNLYIKKMNVGGIFYDMAKAFDWVNHYIVIN